MHRYDMFFFVGLPCAALSVMRILRSFRWIPANVFAIATGLTLLIMVLSGTARGETGRVWLFFAPCWLLLAADLIGKFNIPQRRTIFILEAMCLFCMAAVLRPNFTALTDPQTMPVANQPATYPVNAQFIEGNDRFTLVGLSADRSPYEVTLYLHWRALKCISWPYFFSYNFV